MNILLILLLLLLLLPLGYYFSIVLRGAKIRLKTINELETIGIYWEDPSLKPLIDFGMSMSIRTPGFIKQFESISHKIIAINIAIILMEEQAIDENIYLKLSDWCIYNDHIYKSCVEHYDLANGGLPNEFLDFKAWHEDRIGNSGKQK